MSALLTVGVLLSGCSVFGPGPGPEAEDSPARPVASPEPARPVPAAAEPTVPASTAPAEPPAAPEMLPPAELEARVSRLLDAQGQPFTLMPRDQLAAGTDAAKIIFDNAVVDPAECGETARKNLGQIPRDIPSASGVSAPDSFGSVTVVAMASVDDPAVLAHGLSLDTSQCARFTVKVQGQGVAVTMDELPIDPVGGETVSYLLTQDLPTGHTMFIMAVTAIDGTSTVSAQQIGFTEPDLIAQDELRRLAGELLTGAAFTG
ncbi:hypothetical protein E2F48_05665 [Arthrobacter crusticola]|uniref:Sensor domain-containing protein n=1 Tax=Arthrobacter crusticola TaxID=2547960 RepID=A0A4R5TZK7_9MICC|nr:hypothetical protein [Arthrobacter crusticola]TDK26673.1 hypothetical protein E2F48_05665 [Arthrobacter crusticola]